MQGVKTNAAIAKTDVMQIIQTQVAGRSIPGALQIVTIARHARRLVLLMSLTCLCSGPPLCAQTGTPTYQLLKSFGKTAPGDGPNELIQGKDGLLYGTAWAGGFYGYGTVFKLNPDGTGFTVLKSFDNSTSGGVPLHGLIQGADGALYGTTIAVGLNGAGTGFGNLFKMNLDGSGFTVLKTLTPNDGGAARTLLQGKDGALYGTTYQVTEGGTIFKLNPDGTGFTNLVGLADVSSGPPLNDAVALIQGMDGALYGTTGGGSLFDGVFRLNTDGSDYTVLRHFSGAFPTASLRQAKDGTLYGTTSGTVFRLNPDGSGYAEVWDLGATPIGQLIQGANGALYGAREYGDFGGPDEVDEVFQLSLDGSSFTVLKSFSSTNSDGAGLFGGLI
jgi:uncharacterized repeat protein (TIGR03803 family)